MIRWYDYIIAIVAADMMMSFMLMGFNLSTWWEPLMYGFLTGFVFRLWGKDYTIFRIIQENNRDA